MKSCQLLGPVQVAANLKDKEKINKFSDDD